MKLPDFESPSGDSLSKSANFGLSKWIFNVKNYPNLSVFFQLGAHFLATSIFKPLYLLKSCNLLNELVAEGVAF